MLAADGPSATPHFRYQLEVDVEPTDAPVLKDALEDEPFGLRERYGMQMLRDQLDEHALHIASSSTERWDDFEGDLEILSIYLSQYIVGYEVHVRPTAGAPLLSAWKIIARRGEVLRVEAEVTWNAPSRSVEVGDEDLARIVDRWQELPEWMRNAMRIKYPHLRKL